jgi:hypothetical protein
MCATATFVLLLSFKTSTPLWQALAIAVLLYTQSVRSLLLYIRKRSVGLRVLLSKDLFVIAIGRFIGAFFFFISAAVGEGWLGFVGSPIFLISGTAMIIMSKRAANLANAAGVEEHHN